jgi:2-methylcitrate dehydratase PrpD
LGTIVEELARFTLETKYEDLPAPVVHETKNLLMDSVGCGLAAITTDPGKMAIAIAKALGGPPESSIIGTGDKVSCTNAVLANGQLINSIDFDTVMPGGHAPPYIVPPQLAIAERADATGKELVLATALSFEVAARIAAATPSGMYFDKNTKQFKLAPREGYAKTNIGAAAGVGRMFKLNQKQMVNALANAGHMSQVLTWGRGNYSVPRSMAKYGVPGWQNTGAILGVMFAQMGFMGDIELFDDAEHGFGEFCGYNSWSPEKITPELGKKWLFPQVRYKRYACCGSLHGILEAFYAILKKNNLKPEDIESVTAWTSPTVESPLFTSRELNNIVDIQFGAHYVFALAAYGVRTGVDWQDWDTVTDPKMTEFANRVSIKGDPEYGVKGVNTVEVKAKGKLFKEQTSGPTSKLTDEELLSKYRHNASRVLTLDKIEESVKAFQNLEKVPKASGLMTQLCL